MAILSTLRSVAPYHLLLYSVLFGSTTYQSFFSGIVAYRVLPYDQFGALQGEIFPPYFKFQAAASTLLLLTPPVQFASRVAVTASLGVAAISSLTNLVWLGPRTRELKASRKAQETLEEKEYKDPTASQDMKNINKEFSRVHGASVVLNLGSFVGMLVYGVLLTDGFRRVVRAVPK